MLLLRKDKRTRNLNIQQLKGIPILPSYKYLGIHNDEDLSFRKESQALKQWVLKQASSLSKTNNSCPEHSYHTWKELIESQVEQKLLILSSYVPKLQRQIKSKYYYAAKNIFGIKGNPEASSLLSLVFKDIDLLFKARLRISLSKDKTNSNIELNGDR